MDNEKLQSNNDGLKNIRTFTSDMAEVIRNNEISVAEIATKEKIKREENEEENIYENIDKPKGNKIFFIIGGIIIIILAIFGIYYANKKAVEKNTVIEQTNVDTFVSYDEIDNLDISNVTNKTELVTLLNSKKNSDGKIIRAIFLKIKEGENIKNLPLEQFFSLTSEASPSSLVRSLNNDYLLGEYLKGDINSRFLVFKTNDYNLTYASMLDWEKTMFLDYSQIFMKKINNNEDENKSWVDLVIDNRDARVLYSKDGFPLLYYLFINKDELVITSNIEALKTVVERIIIKK